MSLRFIAFAAMLSASSSFALDDWPQWCGPNRDGISSEEGLLQSWPSAGPEVLWRTQLGEGYSGISIAGEAGFTMFDDGDSEYLLCFESDEGQENWRVRTAKKFRNNWGNGPRSTPTVWDGVVYTVSSHGEVFAVDATTGEVRWNVDLPGSVGCEIPDLGYSSSPLLEGDLVIVSGGGDGSAEMACLDLRLAKSL